MTEPCIERKIIMKIIADLHTHTLVSHHAYSSLEEMVAGAGRANLSAIAITDHGPQMPDGANSWHFTSMWIVPRVINGITVLRGGEANIVSYDGEIDLSKADLDFLDLVIASLHSYAIRPGTFEQNTEVYKKMLRSPGIDILGHPTDPPFEFDMESVVKLAHETGKALELNSHALRKHPEAIEKYRRLALLCKKYDTLLSVSSDAHVSYEVGYFGSIPQMLDELSIPQQLVINAGRDQLARFLESRGKKEAAESVG